MSDSLPTVISTDDSTHARRRSRDESTDDANGDHVALSVLLRLRPELNADFSFVINRACTEFTALANVDPSVTPKQYCARFHCISLELKTAIEKQLEVEQFFTRHSIFHDDVEEHLWPTPGQQFGPYIILEELGRGSLARAYLCAEPHLGNRQVVVKIGRANQCEAHALGQLRHDNIVAILSAEREPLTRLWMISMPFVGRSTLQDWIELAWAPGASRSITTLKTASDLKVRSSDAFTGATGKGPGPAISTHPETVMYVMLKLAEALHHAHTRGIVHGDIKPTNILLTPSGEPLLVDFNLSRNDALRIVTRGGTIPYMAPELLSGIADSAVSIPQVNAQTDVFSMGVLGFILLTGRHPVATAATNDPVELASHYLRGWDAVDYHAKSKKHCVIVELLARCLAPRAADRFQSAREFANALAAQLGWRRRLMRRASDRRRLLAVAAACTSLALASAAGWHLQRPSLEDRYFGEAMRLAAVGETDAARVSLQEVVALNNRRTDALLELGRLELQREDWRAARAAFARMRDQSDRRAEAYLGYSFAMDDQFTAAVPWLVIAAEQSPTSAAVHNNLAVAYRLGETHLSASDRRKEIEEHLAIAMRLNPFSKTVRFNWVSYWVGIAQLPGESMPRTIIDVAVGLAEEQPACAAALEVAARAILLARRSAPSDIDAAIDLLIRARRLSSGTGNDAILSNPLWAPLRQSPKFSELLSSAKAPNGSSATIPLRLEPTDILATVR